MRHRLFMGGTMLSLLALLLSACSAPVQPSTDSDLAAASSSPASSPSPITEPTPAESPTATQATEPTPTESAPTATSAATGESLAPSETVTATGTYTEVLAAEYSIDSDGNAVPDFIETELGYNPQGDDCAEQQCGQGADGADFTRLSNVLLLFDSSGSMAADLGGERKIDAAKNAVKRFARFTSQVGSVGLLVYGHKGNNSEAGKAESCVGIDLLAPLGDVTQDNVDSLMDQFQPTGWTPIAAALQKAPEAFVGRESEPKRIILISDGIETCGGDPVAVARQLYEEQDFNVQIDVVGFDLQSQEDVQQMEAIAAAGGGVFYDAKTADEFDRFFDQQLDAYFSTAEAATCEIGNASQVLLCDQQFTNKATNYLWDRVGEIDSTNPAEADALRALIDDIDARFDERLKLRQAAADRYKDLAERMIELRQQLQNSQ